MSLHCELSCLESLPFIVETYSSWLCRWTAALPICQSP